MTRRDPDGAVAAELLFALVRPEPPAGAVERCAELLREPVSPEGAGLLRLVLAAGVAPLLYRHLAGIEGVPRETLRRLGAPYYGNIRWNRECLAETAAILDALRADGIATIPLKGAVAAIGLLGDEGLYAGGDIDLLVRSSDAARAVDLLRARGYRDVATAFPDSRRASYHHELARERFVVELHWNLVKPPFRADPDFWWEDAVERETPAGNAWALAPEKLLLALIRRLFAHGFSPLRLFLLPVQVASGRGGPLDWQRFVAAAKSCGMERVSRFALAFMKDRLGADVPEWVAAPGRASRGLRARIERALVGAEPIRQLTRVRLLLLCDTPPQLLRTAARGILPPAAEIRWRYGEAARGWRLPLLYLANPLLAMLDPSARWRLAAWGRGRERLRRWPRLVPPGEAD